MDIRKQENRSELGVTLLELMIALSIMGVMASIAIPSFINYQLSAKRAEALANLAALASSEKAHYAEYGVFIGVLAQPMCGGASTCDGGDGLGPDANKHDPSFVKSAFGNLGWEPEGQVFFSYDVVTSGASGSNCGSCNGGCFTAAAYGDLDGNNSVSVILYAQPDLDGNVCDVWLTGTSAPLTDGGVPILGQVVRSEMDDRF